MMNNPPIGPAGALRIAYELIDAQAAYIKQLERGHWSREQRIKVEETREKLEAVKKADELGSCCAAGACDPCERETEPRIVGTLSGATTVKGYPDLPTHGNTSPCVGMGDSWEQNVPPIGTVGVEMPGWSIPEATREHTLQEIEHLRQAAPGLHNPDITHPEDAWPPKGECARCDALQPLWDLEQRTRYAPPTTVWLPDRNPDGTPKITTNPDGTRTLHWQEPDTGPGRTEGGGHS